MKSIHNRNLKGFTLTELIIVMAIIAVLLTIGTISIRGFQKDNMIDRANSNARIVYQAVQDWLNQMKASGTNVFVLKAAPSGTNKYATICSAWADPSTMGLTTVKANGVDIPLADAQLRPMVVKEFQNADNQRNSTILNGLNGSGVKLSDFDFDPDLDRDMEPFLGNKDLEAFAGSWQAVIDVENNTVLYAYWMNRAGAFSCNEQRAMVDGAYGMDFRQRELTQDFFYDHYFGDTVGCYPLYEELVQPAF